MLPLFARKLPALSFSDDKGSRDCFSLGFEMSYYAKSVPRGGVLYRTLAREEQGWRRSASPRYGCWYSQGPLPRAFCPPHVSLPEQKHRLLQREIWTGKRWYWIPGMARVILGPRTAASERRTKPWTWWPNTNGSLNLGRHGFI